MSAALLRCRGVVRGPPFAIWRRAFLLVARLRLTGGRDALLAVPVLVLAAFDLVRDPVFIFEVVVIGFEIVFGPVELILRADLIGEGAAHHSSAFKAASDAISASSIRLHAGHVGSPSIANRSAGTRAPQSARYVRHSRSMISALHGTT